MNESVRTLSNRVSKLRRESLTCVRLLEDRHWSSHRNILVSMAYPSLVTNEESRSWAPSNVMVCRDS